MTAYQRLGPTNFDGYRRRAFIEAAQALDPTKPLIQIEREVDLLLRPGRLPVSRFENLGWLNLVSRISDELFATQFVDARLPQKSPLFATLPTGELNGMAAEISNPSYYVILIDDGVFAFAHLLAKSVSSCFPVTQSHDGYYEYQTRPEHVRSLLARDQRPVDRFVDLLMAYVSGGHPHFAEQYVQPAEGRAMASILRDTMETSVIAHEIGHCALGHLDSGKSDLAHVSEKYGMPLAWVNELAADSYSFHATIERNLSKQNDLATSYSGLELGFWSMELISRTISTLKNQAHRPKLSRSHPPPALRKEAMREQLRQSFHTDDAEAAVDMASNVGATIELLWRLAEDRIRDYGASGLVLHERWGR